MARCGAPPWPDSHDSFLPSLLQVEVQREAAARCFFSLTSSALLLALLLAVACPYAMLQGAFMNGSTAVCLAAGYYLMASFCHLGQAFVNQVGTPPRATPCCSSDTLVETLAAATLSHDMLGTTISVVHLPHTRGYGVPTVLLPLSHCGHDLLTGLGWTKIFTFIDLGLHLYPSHDSPGFLSGGRGGGTPEGPGSEEPHRHL